MTDPPPYRGANGDLDPELEGEPITRTPRWVYVLGIILILLVVLMFMTMHLSSGGFRGHTTP